MTAFVMIALVGIVALAVAGSLADSGVRIRNAYRQIRVEMREAQDLALTDYAHPQPVVLRPSVGSFRQPTLVPVVRPRQRAAA